MVRNNELEKLLKSFGEKIDLLDFISFPETTIDSFESANDVNEELYNSFHVEAYRLIYLHNREMILTKERENQRLQSMVEQTNPLLPNVPIEKEMVSEQQSVQPTSSFSIEFFTNNEDLNAITKYIDSLPASTLPSVKLYFYRNIQILKNKINRLLLSNPTTDISSLLSKIEDYKLLIDYIDEDEPIIEEEKESIPEIVLIPSSKYSSTIMKDILEYLDRSKEIKAALDKIYNGYLKNKKDTKQLKGFDKLYEYTHPNGIRILFVLLPNNKIALCSLFFKDKQKSIKITGYYEEALSRFNECSEYILNNLNDINFNLDQADIIGILYQALENRIPTLKKGSEDNA